MILKINGNIKPYYVQTLALIFFPGARFPENEEITPDTVVGDVDIVEDGEFIRASVRLARGDRCETGESCLSVGGDEDKKRKIAVGEAFMTAGKKLTSVTPPWGILTGVRPAKVATELLSGGITPEDAAETISREYFVSSVKSKLAVDVALAEARLITDEIRRECSVYIGIPFCPTRCAYCSFVSYTSPKLLKMIPDYLTALCADIDGVFSVIHSLGMKVSTVYIGGGTPTILTAEQLETLLSKVREHVGELREFTCEAGRPDTITAEKLKIAAKYGVDRISVNPQTLNDQVLQQIGRAHSADMFYSAYETAREVGIKNVNVDLIAGLPFDTTESFKRSIDGIIALNPENITVHTFSVKRSSEFRVEGRYDPSSAVATESVGYSQEALASAGYLPYYMYRQKNTVGNLENVGYAKPGHEGLYNIYMMEEIHSIFASGASSVTKLVSVPDENGDVRIERLFQPKYPYEYLDNFRGEGYGAKLGELERAARDFFGKE